MKNRIRLAGFDQSYIYWVQIYTEFLTQLPGLPIIKYFIYFSGEVFLKPKLILFVLKSIEISAARHLNPDKSLSSIK